MEKKRPLISVVMPLYNAEKYVGESIESILGQSEGDFELIIVDDASTDASFTVAREYAAQDERIVLLRNAVNGGAALTRNRALDAARGEFIAFMDADDLCPAERFARQVGFFRQHPHIDLCGSYFKSFGQEGASERSFRIPLTHDELRTEMLFGNPLALPTVMLRRDAFKHSGVRFRKSMAEDYQFWCELADSLRLAAIPEFLFFYRRWESQITSSQPERQTESAWAIQRELLSRKLGIRLTDEESRTYSSLSLRGGVAFGREKLTDYRRLLKRIYRTNAECRAYPQKILRKHLVHRYKYACRLFCPAWIVWFRKRLLQAELLAL